MRITRRTVLLSLPGVAACTHRREAPLDVFPETVAGVWHRAELRDVPVSEAPDPVPRNSVKRVQAAIYEGPGRLEARVYELSSVEVGLDLAQRWRPSADTVFFWARQYFVVVKWDRAERTALQAFTREMEKRLNAG